MFTDVVVCFRDTGIGYVDLSGGDKRKNVYVNVHKSDGTTLYVTR